MVVQGRIYHLVTSMTFFKILNASGLKAAKTAQRLTNIPVYWELTIPIKLVRIAYIPVASTFLFHWYSTILLHIFVSC